MDKDTQGGFGFWGEPISSYTREDGIADGMLVPLADIDGGEDLGRQAGFTQPVCLTRSVYEACNTAHGDLSAWLWDVLYVGAAKFRAYARTVEGSPVAVGPVAYQVKIGRRLRKVWLEWNSFEAFTIMFPEDH